MKHLLQITLSSNYTKITALERTVANYDSRHIVSSGSFCQIKRVNDEAFIAETMVWPNFFLMNVFFALKGSKPFFIIISLSPAEVIDPLQLTLYFI